MYVWVRTSSSNPLVFRHLEQPDSSRHHIRKAALARIEQLTDAELRTAEGEALDILTDLVELYEEKSIRRWPE